MLTVLNREELLRDAALRPMIERTVRALSREQRAEIICRPTVGGFSAPWIVLLDEAGIGMGLWTDELLPCATELRRAIVRVRCVAAIMNAFGGASAFPLALSSMREPPAEWPRYSITIGADVCVVACSPGLPQTGLWETATEFPIPRVRVPLWCELPLLSATELLLERVPVRIGGRNIQGWLRCADGGAMTIEIVEKLQEPGPAHAQVRVELGVIELTLEELLSLRPGSVLEIGAALPLACTLSVGATEIVRAMLEPSEGGFLLRIAPKS